MYKNSSKTYYITLSTTTSTSEGSSNTNSFVTTAAELAVAYNKNKKTDYSNLMVTLNNLKKANTNYVLNSTSNTLVTLINIINSLILTNEDVESQLRLLELQELTECRQSITRLGEKTIEQNSGIKLVYLQYLLMYDITLTNGNFFDEYLLEAQKVLDENGGLLKHF